MLPIPSHVRGLVFDCDGTLVDSMPLHKRLWAEVIEPHGVIIPDGFIDAHAGLPTEAIVEILNREQGSSIDPKRLHEHKEQLFVERLHEVGPIESVVATAREYLGKLPMAVVSGGVRMNVMGCLRNIGATDWFPVVLTADDPFPPKPAPDLFLEAARLLGLAPEECHVFEDGDPGIRGAREAGMSVTDVREVVMAT